MENMTKTCSIEANGSAIKSPTYHYGYQTIKIPFPISFNLFNRLPKPIYIPRGKG